MKYGKGLDLESLIRQVIVAIGDDPNRDGLLETPQRVVKAYSELFSGYDRCVEKEIKVFVEAQSDEMVLLKNVEFYSTCEHHMMPFFGKAHIAYIPNGGRIIGVSKLARILEIFSRRLQIQERLTAQVTGALDKHLDPKGSACMIEAVHFCMTCRGVAKQRSTMITNSLTGVFRKPEVRHEFMAMVKD